MKAATIQEIKKELNNLSPSRLEELCLRLAKFKKDNKELLTYLLFESEDLTEYIGNVKKEIDAEFKELPKPNLYLTKKSLRKILRITAKQIRYTGSPQAEVELLTYFCAKIKDSGIPIKNSPVLVNLYNQQQGKSGTKTASQTATTPANDPIKPFLQGWLDARGQALCWSAVFFLASAAASSAVI